MAAADSSVGFAILVNHERIDVPAWLALIPELAINPKANDVSSMEYPRDPAKGAAYLKDSPNLPTFVFELVAAQPIRP